MKSRPKFISDVFSRVVCSLEGKLEVVFQGPVFSPTAGVTML